MLLFLYSILELLLEELEENENMITIYGKEAVLLEGEEHKTLSVVQIGEKIVFVKDETIKEALK